MSDGGTQAEEATVSESYAFISAIVIWVILIIIAPIWIFHSIKSFQDLCTKNRASVSHRKKKPELTVFYKAIILLSWVAITLLVMSHIGSVTLYFATRDYHCDMSWIFAFKFQQFSKTAMYCVFILRLFTIYRQSAHSYSKKCILIFGIIFIIYCTFVNVLLWIVVSAEVFTYDGPSYPNWCAPGPDTFQIYGSLTLLQDIIVCIGFLWAFLSPLRKTVGTITTDGQQNTTKKIIYAGTKTFIVTTVALSSTVIFIMLAIVTGIGLFGACDLPTNAICIALMTTYYPDHIYYEKLCCCCIKCCSKNAKQMDDEADAEEQRTKNLEPSTTEKTISAETATTTNTTASDGTTTVDTASALRVAGAKYNDEYKAVEKESKGVVSETESTGEEVP